MARWIGFEPTYSDYPVNDRLEGGRDTSAKLELTNFLNTIIQYIYGGIMNNCLNCQKETRNNKFCSQSCSAKFTNLGRKHSQESKDKRARKLKDYFQNNEFAMEISRKCGFSQRGKRWAKDKNSSWLEYKESAVFYTPYYILELLDKDNLVEKYGWYHPKKNINGVSRDHMYSVKDGWDNNVPLEIIKHPANCKIMPIIENKKKGSKSSITLQELYQRIEDFEQCNHDRT